MAKQLFQISREASDPSIALACGFEKKNKFEDMNLQERINNLEKTILIQGDEITQLKNALSDSMERMKLLESEKETALTRSTSGGDKSRSSSRKVQNGENDKKDGHVPAWKPPGLASPKANTLK